MTGMGIKKRPPRSAEAIADAEARRQAALQWTPEERAAAIEAFGKGADKPFPWEKASQDV
jgi:hypothetical protein